MLERIREPYLVFKRQETLYLRLEWAKGFTRSQRTQCFALTLMFRQSRPYPDPLVKVYDLRTMRALPPIPFPSGPAFIHVLPKRTSSLVVTSLQGLVNVVDASDPGAPGEFHQVSVLFIVTFSNAKDGFPVGHDLLPHITLCITDWNLYRIRRCGRCHSSTIAGPRRHLASSEWL